MPKLNHLAFSLALLAVTAYGQKPAVQSFPTLPQGFEPNRGQTASTFGFVSHGPGYTLSLAPSSAVLQLVAQENRAATVRLRLVGADSTAHGQGLERQTGKTNYFLGNDSSRWLTDVPQFGRVEYHNVYPGIDIAYYGNNQRLEYDFIVQPHADPGRIRFAVDGADQVRIDAAGDLVLTVGSAEIREPKPSVYEETEHGRRLVEGRYLALKNNQIAFELENYDESHRLVIDPVLVFSTYFGGAGAEQSYGIALDAGGNTYLAGNTASANLPGLPGNAFGSFTFNGSDTAAFVAKISPAGTLIFTTIVAGANDIALGTGVALDANGNIYVSGNTSSTSFPTVNPIQATYGGGPGDAFILELNSTGNALIYSTYLGGSANDFTEGIAVDSNGNTLVAGGGRSTNFPVTGNAFQSAPDSPGNPTPWAAKIAPGGSSLVYSTYYGGLGFSNGLTIDSAGDLVVYGDTQDTGLHLVNALPTSCVWTQGGSTFSHGWVAEFNVSGAPIFSTYICGSDGSDSVRGAAVDASGNLLLTGNTSSSTFPTLNPIQAHFGGGSWDSFVTKLTTGGSLLYSTYLGGTGDDFGRGAALDQLGNAYITGETTSPDFPAVGATQSQYGGGDDAFLTKINTGGTAIAFSTYIGGSNTEIGRNVAVDGLATAHVTGTTASTDFHTASPLQPNYGGGSTDAFLTVISTCDFSFSSAAPLGPAGGTGSTSITTTPECGWAAVSDNSWITITSSPASGAGSGSVSWSVSQNTGPLRTGGLTIAGKTVSITQSGPVTPTITWAPPAAITSGTALSATQLDASASVPGTFVYNPAAGTVLPVGNGQTLSVNFTPTDTTNYTPASGSTTINVNPAPPQPIDVSSQVNVTSSGLLYSRAANAYSGTLTIRNIGATPIAAPIQSVLSNLSSVATLINATGRVPSGPYAGAPYITVPGSSALAPGASVTIPVQFRQTGTAPIYYLPKTLSGGF